MAPTWEVVLSVLLAIRIATWIGALARYKSATSKSGWPCYFSPVHVNNTAYLFAHRIVASASSWMPLDHIRPWLPWTSLFHIWHAGYSPFEDAASDSFFLNTVSGNMLLTSDPAVSWNILKRSSEFESPAETLRFYNVFGPSVAACNDEDWRRYRKISMPYFDRQTIAAVWRETITKTEELFCELEDITMPLENIKSRITARVALGVISKVFFGRDMGQSDFVGNPKIGLASRLSFGEALFRTADELGVIIMTHSLPGWLTRLIPSTITAPANHAYHDFKGYLKEMYAEVSCQTEAAQNSKQRYTTLLESLVHAENAGGETSRPGLSQEEVFGNIFFFILAGYDNVSNITAFALLLLALHDDCQQQTYEEINKFQLRGAGMNRLGDYESQKLIEGYLGAVVKETLRLYNPVEWMARRSKTDATVMDNSGKPRFIPKNTICVLDFAAMFRSPKYWHTVSLNGVEKQSPAFQFLPERWFQEGNCKVQDNPSPYIPFSAGKRACPGKRFAEAQICGLLAQVLSVYSVKLVENKEDQKEAHLRGHSKKWVLDQAKSRAAQSLFEDVGFNQGIFPSKHFPIRFEKR